MPSSGSLPPPPSVARSTTQTIRRATANVSSPISATEFRASLSQTCGPIHTITSGSNAPLNSRLLSFKRYPDSLRSPHEVFFRIRQEVANLWLFTAAPAISDGSWQPQHLPSSQAITTHLRGSSFATEVEALAGKILAGTVPLLGFELNIGHRPSWRKDYLSGIESA